MDKQDPLFALQKAINKLEQFSQDPKGSPLLLIKEDKLLELARSFFNSNIKDQYRIRKQELREAIDIIRRHYLLLEKLKTGTAEQKKLASSAFSVITNFNSLIADAQKIPLWTKKVADFLCRHQGFETNEDLKEYQITLPETTFLTMKAVQTTKSDSWQKVDILRERLEPQVIPTQQETDAFIMKGITLLKEVEKFQFIPRLELGEMLRKQPILTRMSKAPNDESKIVVNFQQILKPIPGYLISIEGSFLRSSELKNFSIPQAFHTEVRSFHLGFPYPSQHTGWALPGQVLPDFPIRLKEMPLFESLFNKKESISRSIRETNNLVEKIYNYQKCISKAFYAEKERFISLHLQLFTALLSAGGAKKDLPIVNHFFSQLAKESHPFEKLVQTMECINDIYVGIPFTHLHEEWLENNQSAVRDENPTKRMQAIKQILKKEIQKANAEISMQRENTNESLHRASLDFVEVLGNLIGNSLMSLFLQYMSEKMKFPPPELTVFEKKLQICGIMQISSFIQKIQDSVEEKKLQGELEKLIQEEIDLFKKPSIPKLKFKPYYCFVEEFERYYKGRWKA